MRSLIGECSLVLGSCWKGASMESCCFAFRRLVLLLLLLHRLAQCLGQPFEQVSWSVAHFTCFVRDDLPTLHTASPPLSISHTHTHLC
jgi:hypothetical protein